jgi:hypothetical protein
MNAVEANPSLRDIFDGTCHLTNRSSGRVRDKVPSSNVCARAAQLNR